MNESVPGGAANTALRIIGVAVLLASAGLGLWITTELGTTWDPISQRAVDNPLAIPLALALFVQGVILSALFIALAGMGDNLIAIRRHTAPTPEPPDEPSTDGPRVRCPNCHTVFTPDDPKADRARCPSCNANLSL